MKYRKLKCQEIQVAASYQRQVSTSEVNRIAREFEPEALGVLIVGQRSDGSLWCVDGQTRLAALIKLGITHVGCVIFESNGKQHEARVFRELNHHRQVSKIDKLQALLCEGEESAVAMMKIVNESGFGVAFSGVSRDYPNTRCVAALEYAHKSGVLSETLEFIASAWDSYESNHAVGAPAIGGVTLFIKRFGEVLDVDAFARKLRRYDPVALVGKCDARKMQGGSRRDAFFDVLVELYNITSRGEIAWINSEPWTSQEVR